MLIDKITFFFFLKEEKVAFNEKKKKIDTLKYLSIIIKTFSSFGNSLNLEK